MRAWGRAVVAIVVISACAAPQSAAPPRTAAIVGGPPGQPPPPAPPLPKEWAWPLNASSAAHGLTPMTVHRPVNVAALRARRGTSPCAPVEVAPSIWITPPCKALPLVSRSPMARPLALRIASRAELPPSFELRAVGLDGPIKHQQALDVCWAFAISTVMDNALLRAGRADSAAPLHLIVDQAWGALVHDGRGRPTVPEAAWPYDPYKACKLDEDSGDTAGCIDAYGIQPGTWRDDPALAAERARAESSGQFEVIGVQTLASLPPNPDQVATAIVSGVAVYAQLMIDMQAWSQQNVQADGFIPDWPRDHTLAHDVALTGFRTVGGQRQFQVHNSWGTGWADGGYAWIAESTLTSKLTDAWTVTLGDASGRPLPAAPPPAPPPRPAPAPLPQPAADRCWSSQVRVGESACTDRVTPGSPRPGNWLTYCRRNPSGDTSGGWIACEVPTRIGTSVSDAPLCVSRVVGGRSEAACCPSGSRTPTDPGCVPPPR